MHDWRAEFGYQALFSCCTYTGKINKEKKKQNKNKKKPGVIILFNDNFAFSTSKTYCDLILNSKYSFFCLMAKHYIYICRSKEWYPTQSNFLRFLKHTPISKNRCRREWRMAVVERKLRKELWFHILGMQKQ